MLVFTTMGIILLVVSILLFGFIFWYCPNIEYFI